MPKPHKKVPQLNRKQPNENQTFEIPVRVITSRTEKRLSWIEKWNNWVKKSNQAIIKFIFKN